MSYRYDKLKKEFQDGLKNDATDIEYMAAFKRKYKVTKLGDPKRSIPQSGLLYDWYQDKTGRRLSSWYSDEQKAASNVPQFRKPQVTQQTSIKVPTLPKSPNQGTAEPPKQPAAPIAGGAPEIPDVSHVRVEGEAISPQPEPDQANPIPPEAPMSQDITLKNSGKKIKVELGKVGIIVADFENWIYKRWGLRPMTEEERVETTRSVATVVDNRLQVASEYGDYINVALTIGGHVSSRVIEARLEASQQKAQQEQQAKSGGQQDPYRPLNIDPKTGSVIWD